MLMSSRTMRILSSSAMHLTCCSLSSLQLFISFPSLLWSLKMSPQWDVCDPLTHYIFCFQVLELRRRASSAPALKKKSLSELEARETHLKTLTLFIHWEAKLITFFPRHSLPASSVCVSFPAFVIDVNARAKADHCWTPCCPGSCYPAYKSCVDQGSLSF